MPLLPPKELIGRLAEACAIIRSMWTEDEIDFEGDYYRLRRARCEPKPIQKPHAPILIGARGQQRTLRLVAQHADAWNVPGFPTGIVDDFRLLSYKLDDHCRIIGRDPSTIVRSVPVHVDMSAPATMVETISVLSQARVPGTSC